MSVSGDGGEDRNDCDESLYPNVPQHIRAASWTTRDRERSSSWVYAALLQRGWTPADARWWIEGEIRGFDEKVGGRRDQRNDGVLP